MKRPHITLRFILLSAFVSRSGCTCIDTISNLCAPPSSVFWWKGERERKREREKEREREREREEEKRREFNNFKAKREEKENTCHLKTPYIDFECCWWVLFSPGSSIRSVLLELSALWQYSWFCWRINPKYSQILSTLQDFLYIFRIFQLVLSFPCNSQCQSSHREKKLKIVLIASDSRSVVILIKTLLTKLKVTIQVYRVWENSLVENLSVERIHSGCFLFLHFSFLILRINSAISLL